MGEQKPLRERPERDRWFSKKQYEMLRRCSDKKDVTEWNCWREKHFSMPVFLEGADLQRAHLEGADLREAHLEGAFISEAHLEGANVLGAHLEGAHLESAHLEGAALYWAHLQGAVLREAHLERAVLSGAHLEGAKLDSARLEGADLWNAHLENAWCWEAHLEGSSLWMAHLEGAMLWQAHLEGAFLRGTYLEGAHFHMAVVDGSTLLTASSVDRRSYFTGVALDNARVEPGLKQLLEYNIRRRGWEQWYEGHPVAQWPVRAFWAMSDYGLSIRPILGWFFGLATAFALVYWVCSLLWPPGIVSNLLADGGLSVPGWLLPLRALYFSIITMTTLGFGDIYAYPTSFWGHLLLTLQVLLGYVLLAALVTRFAVLFTAGGPAGKFAAERSVLSRLWERVRTREG